MLDVNGKTPYSKRMSKSRLFIQAALGIFLAFGLIISPLQNPTVVFSARFEEDVAPPAEADTDAGAEQSGEVVSVEEPSVEAPREAPVEVISDNPAAPENVGQSPVPDSTQDIPVEMVPSSDSQSPEVVESPVLESAIEETIGPDNPEAQPSVEETRAIELPLTTPQVVEEVQPTLPDVAPVPDQNEGSVENEEQSQILTPWVSGQVVVSFEPSISTEEQIARLTALGLEIVSTSEELGMMIVKVPEGLELESVSALTVMDGIQYAEPVYLASALDILPNDPGYSNQENMNVIKAPGGWQYFTGSSNVIIAVIDSGVDINHPDLYGKVIPGWDYVNGDNDAQDDYGHGTHVAGIAAAIGNNSTGVAGLDWSAKILSVKVLDNTGSGTAANIAMGIRYAVDHGANIVNLSLTVPFDSVLVSSAIEYAYQHGVTVVASTGNNNGAVNFPAAYPHVIAVGAVDNTETLWALSNHGAEIDLVAPGVNIYSTDITTYSTRTGTSMAAAHVSGLAALLLGMTSLTPDQVKTSIQDTSKDLGTSGWDSFFGYGLIQVKDAILRLFNALFPVVREESQTVEPTIIFWPTITPTPTPTPAS
jgi:subtilisin family serine protease